MRRRLGLGKSLAAGLVKVLGVGGTSSSHTWASGWPQRSALLSPLTPSGQLVSACRCFYAGAVWKAPARGDKTPSLLILWLWHIFRLRRNTRGSERVSGHCKG